MTTQPSRIQLGAANSIQQDIAVIDVGSNSIRLVHFRLEGRAIWPIFNEKVMAALGEGVRKTGRLNPDGVETALRALKRFQRILDAKSVSDRLVVATAAVREAEDGSAFVDRVAEETGIEIRVLSGKEEGELSARGLVTGIPDAHGVTGDLGGSSLELTPINHGDPGAGQTFALGPQAIIPSAGWDHDEVRQRIDDRLAQSEFLHGAGGCFYAVGGAWRALAQLAFARQGYPLRVVHQFSLDRSQLDELTRFVTGQSQADLLGIKGVSKRRASHLPYAALLLRRLLELGDFTHVVFSAYGLREGVLMDSVPEPVRSLDPLLAGADALARPSAPSPTFSEALARWIEPAVSEIETAFSPIRDTLLHEAAARLTDIGARLHPDHRTGLARDLVLASPIAGVTHAERVFLAAAVHFRYGGRRRELAERPEFGLVNEDQLNVAQMLGMTLRLGAKLSGRSEDLLANFQLSVIPELVRLEVDESVHDLYVERSLMLLGSLAGAIGRRMDVYYV